MSEWKDWYSDPILSKKVRNDVCSIDFNRLNNFANKIISKYEYDNDSWYYVDIANRLLVLNTCIREPNTSSDYVWVVDEFENEGLFEPCKQSFLDCLHTIEIMTGIQL